MVHALSEMHRMIATGGILVDLRPRTCQPKVVIVSGDDRHLAGVIDDEAGAGEDQAADQAVETTVARGWFKQRTTVRFHFDYYWDSAQDMHAYLSERWGDFAVIPDEVVAEADRLLAAASLPAQVRVRTEMMLSLYEAL
jgi:hypothetical protein